ncbi:MAG: hypothetical protein VB071_09055 [Lawsonibacter sp.]|nr:hypothetical protein [Lawsonibacter sp.]
MAAGAADPVRGQLLLAAEAEDLATSRHGSVTYRAYPTFRLQLEPLGPVGLPERPEDLEERLRLAHTFLPPVALVEYQEIQLG